MKNCLLWPMRLARKKEQALLYLTWLCWDHFRLQWQNCCDNRGEIYSWKHNSISEYPNSRIQLAFWYPVVIYGRHSKNVAPCSHEDTQHSIYEGKKKRLISVFGLRGVQYEHGEWGEVAPSNWSRVEFTFKVYLTCIHYLLLSVAMANWWTTGNDKRRAFTSRNPPSCIKFTPYREGSACLRRVHSRWCLLLSTSHTEHHYNTVCHWLDVAIVVHTPVTLTLREKREAAHARSRAESQAPTRPSPPLHLHPPSGCFGFTKAFPKPQKNVTTPELLNP